MKKECCSCKYALYIPKSKPRLIQIHYTIPKYIIRLYTITSIKNILKKKKNNFQFQISHLNVSKQPYCKRYTVHFTHTFSVSPCSEYYWREKKVFKTHLNPPHCCMCKCPHLWFGDGIVTFIDVYWQTSENICPWLPQNCMTTALQIWSGQWWVRCIVQRSGQRGGVCMTVQRSQLPPSLSCSAVYDFSSVFILRMGPLSTL